MKKQSWNVQINGFPYTIEASVKEVSVNPGETASFKKFKKSGSMFDQIYEIPVDGTSVYLHIDFFGKRTLVVDGIDCNTGEAFVPFKMPGWGWIFVILHAINFFMLVGGAIGGVLAVLMLGLTARIASNSKDKTAVRVWKCIGLWLLATVLEFIFAVFLVTLLY